jgi:hypothetical protein
MRTYMIMIAALLLISFASASVDMISSANTAVTGDNSYVAQAIYQAGMSDDTVSETATNTVTATGDDAVIGQTTTQAAVADTVTQVAANSATVSGEDPYVGQAIYSGASGDTVTQRTTNTATLDGANPVVGQVNVVGAVGGKSVSQELHNNALYYSTSVGGMLGQELLASAVADTVEQIQENLAKQI